MANEPISFNALIKTFIAYFLYILLFTALLPLLPLRLLWRSIKAPEYRKRMLERFGVFSIRPKKNGIWIHAVSVGETVAAAPLIRALQQIYPDRAITVTTTTPTGSERVVSLLGDSVSHVYAPYDWPLFVWLFLRHVKPSISIVMETELWPVSIVVCRLMSVPVVVANARLSQKSAAGYAKVSWLSNAMLRCIAVATQHSEDAKRFLDLGVRASQLQITGSIKFDIELPSESQSRARDYKQEWRAANKSFVWIAASTHPGEDEIVLTAHRKILSQHPNILLVLVPRHPERFDEVAGLTLSRGFSLQRRSQEEALLPNTDVLLIDVMGELLTFYGAADIALVGGSLVPVGGHNCLEPAAWSVPVLSGPYTHNFEHIVSLLKAENALEVIVDDQQLAQAISQSISGAEARVIAGRAARKVLDQNRGAQKKLLKFIARQMN